MKNLTSYLKVNNIVFAVFDTQKEGIKRVYVRVEEVNKYPKVVRFIKDNYFWELVNGSIGILVAEEE